jgi:hypothetical protein
LEGAHVVDGLCCAGEAVLGFDFGGFCCGGSSVGAGVGVSLGVAGAGSATKDVTGLESSGGHGGQEGGEEGACENGTRTPPRCEELEGAEVVFGAVASFQHGAEIFDRINRIDRILRIFRQDDRICRSNRTGMDCVFDAAFFDLKPVFLLCALCVLCG